MYSTLKKNIGDTVDQINVNTPLETLENLWIFGFLMFSGGTERE